MKRGKIRFLSGFLSLVLLTQSVLPTMAAGIETGDNGLVKENTEITIDKTNKTDAFFSETEVSEKTEYFTSSANLEAEGDSATVVVEADDMVLYQKGRFDIAEGAEDDELDMSVAESFYETWSEAIDDLYQQLKNKVETIDLKKYQIPTSDIGNIVWGCVNEHPDLYYVDKYSYNYNRNTLCVNSITPVYINGYDDELFQIAVEEALLVIEPGMTDLEKAIALHDYIILNCQYNYDDYLAGTLVDSDYSAYGILALKEGVCNGYALAYKYLCNLVGIECYMVSSETMNHAWNLIKLNGEYYQVDVTWDDPTWDRIGRVRHFYMFSSDEEFIVNREHKNWTVTHYNVAVDLKATDINYDDYYWMNIDSAMVYDDHDYYYVDSGDRKLKKIDTATMSVTDICSLGVWYTWEGNGYWSGAFSGLFELNNRLYFNKSDGIYSIDPYNTTDMVKEADNPKASTGRMYGCALQQGEIKYTVSTTPNLKEAWPVYTLQLQEEIEVPVSKVTFVEEKVEVLLGENLELGYNVYPTYAEAKQIIWSSSNRSVATVDNGVVTAVGVGNCLITVTVDGISAVCEVTVVRRTESPVFTPAAGTIDIGDIVEITAEEGAEIYYTVDGSEPTMSSQVYTSGIKIEEDTVIKAMAVKEGYDNSYITTGKYIACSNKLELYETRMEIREGDYSYLYFTEIPTTKRDADIKVTIADENIATVDEEFCVRGISPGQTVITATVEDHKGRTVTTQATVIVKPITYMVYFQYYDEDRNTYLTHEVQNVAKGGSATLPESAPIKNGYRLVGWDGNYNNIQENTYINAIFELEDYSIAYEVGIGSNGTGNPNTYTIESEEIIFSDAIAPQGYTFEGWYWDAGYHYPAKSIAKGCYGNKNLYARYQPVIYNVTYDIKDGMNTSENIFYYTIETDTFVLKEPIGFYGDIFAGWYADDKYQQEVTEIEKGSTGNKAFFAKWQLAKPVYSNENNEILKGQSVALESERPGAQIYYTTDGTIPDTNAMLYTSPIVIDKEMTIKAITVYEGYENSEVATMTYIPYEAKSLYTVCFMDEKGNILKQEKVEEGKDATEPQAPERSGYRFVGWNKPTTNIQNDEIFLPLYEIIRYSITYVVNGGVNDIENPDSYTMGDSVTLKEAKEKAGFIFDGWYLDKECQENPVTVIENGSTGDITLYAKWRDERGLWMEEIAPQSFTGGKVQPTELKVYDGASLLQSGKDYTISYKNNVNANDLSSEDLTNAPAVVVTGKGNYAGKVVKNFVITPKSIEDADVRIDDLALVYKEGQVQKPVPKVLWKGKNLKKNKDFTITYEHETREDAFSKEGKYTIWVEGNGNYSGKRKVTLTITSDQILISKVKVVKIPNQEYTGKAVKVEELLELKYQNDTLVPGVDYELSYEPCVEVGTHQVTIYGKGKFIGVADTSFRITGISMSKVKVDGIPSKLYYTGNEITIADEQWDTPISLSCTVKNGKQSEIISLTKENYEVSYKNNREKGTAQIIFTGKNGYTGTLKKTFKIVAYDIGEDKKGKMNIDTEADIIIYEKNGAKPEMVVKFGSIKLEPKKDYTVSYKNNNGVNSFTDEKADAVAIIRGKGNYSGKKEISFKILPKDIGTVNIEVADLVEGKAGKYRSVPKLTDSNGKKLVSGVDYEKEIIYCDETDKILEKNEKVEAGNNITVIVTAKENGNYTGEIRATYRIVEKGKDISKSKATIAKGLKFYYNGRKITLNKEDLVVKLGGKTLLPENFKILNYSNNVEKGTATVTIEGVGEYGGRKQIKFKIQSQAMKWWGTF